MTLFTRDLLKYGQDIEIADRDARTVSGVMQEVFSNEVTVKALTKTVNGVTIFDDTNIEQDITHRFVIVFVAGITSEKWIKLKGKRYRILKVENCCEADGILILHCTERGIDTIEVNDA